MTDPIDYRDSSELLTALDTFLTTMGQVDMESTYQSLNCEEVEAVAEVLRLSGPLLGKQVEAERAARLVLEQHYEADEPGDRHFMDEGQAVLFYPSTVRVEPGQRPRRGVVQQHDRTGIVQVAW